ncbi:unnamed protein product, partial [Musa banksii]
SLRNIRPPNKDQSEGRSHRNHRNKKADPISLERNPCPISSHSNQPSIPTATKFTPCNRHPIPPPPHKRLPRRSTEAISNSKKKRGQMKRSFTERQRERERGDAEHWFRSLATGKKRRGRKQRINGGG